MMSKAPLTLAVEIAHWNNGASELYVADLATATAGMGAHFVGGSILLFLGSVQLIQRLRLRDPAVHRWLGRVYVGASGITAVGGLTFILLNGTIGGPVMSFPLGLPSMVC